MVRRSTAIVGTLIALITITSALRLENEENTELTELKAQQKFLGSRVS